MERTIIRKQLSDETLKQISAETVYFVSFFDNEQTAEKGCLQFFSIEKDECIVYSGDWHRDKLTLRNVFRKFPMLLDSRISGDWKCVRLDCDKCLFMRKHLYPVFQETMQTYYELPPGSDGKIQFLDFMTFSFEAQESFTRNLPKYRKQRSTIRHWKTCTEAVMKKLA